MTRPRIAVVMEGGVVNNIITDDPLLVNLPVLIIEYDADDEEAISIAQPDMSEQMATVGVQRIEKSKLDLPEIWKESKS